LKGQFQDIWDNSKALTERMNNMNKKMEDLVQQNHTHFTQTAGFRKTTRTPKRW
jgi:hypothetical protein